MRTEKQKQWYKENYKKVLEKNREYRKNNLEKVRAYARESYNRLKSNIEHKRRCMLKDAKARAKREEMDFNITLDDIVIPEYCPYFKTKFVLGDSRYSPSLDRIDSTKGYTKDNVWVISTLANRMKHDASVEELKAFAIGVLSLEGGYSL